MYLCKGKVSDGFIQSQMIECPAKRLLRFVPSVILACKATSIADSRKMMHYQRMLLACSLNLCSYYESTLDAHQLLDYQLAMA